VGIVPRAASCAYLHRLGLAQRIFSTKFGLRLAFRAPARLTSRSLVLDWGGRLAAAGTCYWIAVGVGLARLLVHLLEGVSATDPVTIFIIHRRRCPFRPLRSWPGISPPAARPKLIRWFLFAIRIYFDVSYGRHKYWRLIFHMKTDQVLDLINHPTLVPR